MLEEDLDKREHAHHEQRMSGMLTSPKRRELGGGRFALVGRDVLGSNGPRSLAGSMIGEREDEVYDGCESASNVTEEEKELSGAERASQAGEEKKAAWLLMKLSVRDGETSPVLGDVHRVKRRRAISM